MLADQIKEMKASLHMQNKLYDEIVLTHLDSDEFGKHYQEYLESLGYFDVRAFHNVMDRIINTNDGLSEIAERFTHIPKYITARNNFDTKVKDILEQDGSNADKQAQIDALDRNRTREHDHVISLFNTLNQYARNHDMAEPYPNFGADFNKYSPEDREKVASALMRHEPLMEKMNHLTRELDPQDAEVDRGQYIPLSTLMEQYKQLSSSKDSLTGQLNNSLLSTQLDDSLLSKQLQDGLNDLDNEGLIQ